MRQSCASKLSQKSTIDDYFQERLLEGTLKFPLKDSQLCADKSKSKQQNSISTVFVKNIEYKRVTEETFKVFLKNSHISWKKIRCFFQKGRMRGQAFILFWNQKQALEAIKLLNGKVPKFQQKPIFLVITFILFVGTFKK